MQIDKGITIPEKDSKYPFQEMAVGDSFFFENEREKVRSSASNFGARNNIKFAFRKVEGGFRCWRVS